MDADPNFEFFPNLEREGEILLGSLDNFDV